MHWSNTVTKHGYYVEIKFSNLSWKSVCKLEIAWIKKLGRKDLGLGNLVNHTDGGDGNHGMVHTEEWKKNHSIRMTGEKHPMYNVKHDKETRDIISKNTREALKNPEVKNRLIESRKEYFKTHKSPMFGKKNPALAERNRNYKFTEEQLSRMAPTQFKKGFKHSEEHLERLRKRCLDENSPLRKTQFKKGHKRIS